LRLFSLGGYGLALAALALAVFVFGAIECPPFFAFFKSMKNEFKVFYIFFK